MEKGTPDSNATARKDTDDDQLHWTHVDTNGKQEGVQ